MSSHEEREVQYFSALERHTQEAEEKTRLQEEEARIKEKQRLAKIELEKMKNEERIAEQNEERIRVKNSPRKTETGSKSRKIGKRKNKVEKITERKRRKTLDS